jgi:hypothetical protein
MPSRLTDQITDERELFIRAFLVNGRPVELAIWATRYHDAIRHRRVAALLHFTHYAARMAQHHETDGRGWYGRHVCWAIGRLVQLGYTFPETEQLRVRPPELRAVA